MRPAWQGCGCRRPVAVFVSTLMVDELRLVLTGAESAAAAAEASSSSTGREWASLRAKHDVFLNDVLQAADNSEAETAEASNAISTTLQVRLPRAADLWFHAGAA